MDSEGLRCTLCMVNCISFPPDAHLMLEAKRLLPNRHGMTFKYVCTDPVGTGVFCLCCFSHVAVACRDMTSKPDYHCFFMDWVVACDTLLLPVTHSVPL